MQQRQSTASVGSRTIKANAAQRLGGSTDASKVAGSASKAESKKAIGLDGST